MAKRSSRAAKVSVESGKSLDLSTAVLRTNGGLPLYAQLLTVFRRRIESGEWAVGQRIPTLQELVSELNVARVTIRHAIGLLEAEGLIGRYQGRGTYVLRRPDSPIWYRIPLTWEELIGTTPDIEFEVLFDGEADHPPASFHGKGNVAPSYHFLHRLLLRHRVPYGIGATYIEDGLFRAIGRKAFNSPTPLRLIGQQLKQELGLTEQTVRAGSAELEIANLLGLSPHAPVMIVTRSILSNAGTLVYESMGTFRADFVEIHSEFLPSTSAIKQPPEKNSSRAKRFYT